MGLESNMLHVYVRSPEGESTIEQAAQSMGLSAEEGRELNRQVAVQVERAAAGEQGTPPDINEVLLYMNKNTLYRQQ